MWYHIIGIVEWFGERKERYRLVRDFNRAAKNAFIIGLAPTLLETKITRVSLHINTNFQNLWVVVLE